MLLYHSDIDQTRRDMEVFKLGRGSAQRYSATGKRNGIDIKVIVEPKGKGIVTGYPVPQKGIKRGE